MSTTHGAAEYLFRSSNAGLESFQLSRLARSAGLRKELLRIVNDIVRSEAEARAARWLRDSRSADNVTCEIPADSLVPLEKSPQNEAATRRLVPWAEPRAEALLPADKLNDAQTVFLSDSFSTRDTVVESVDSRESFGCQLRLFACGDGAVADNLKQLEGGSDSEAPAERLFVPAHRVSSKSFPPGLLNVAGNVEKAVDPLRRLVRAAKLNRFSVASPRSFCNRTNETSKMNVVAFPISGGNADGSSTNFVLHASPAGPICLDLKPAPIFPRSLRKDSAVTLGSPFALLARSFAVDSRGALPAHAQANARRA